MSAEQRSNSSNFAVLELPRPSDVRRFEATIGQLVAVESTDLNGSPQVRFIGLDGEVKMKTAQTTVSLESAKPEQEVILMFMNGDPDAPVITGLLQPNTAMASAQTTPVQNRSEVEVPQPKRKKKIELDAQELLLSADSEITLKCGKSSLTLKRDGRVVIRGVHLLSRASSVNRIRGGSIQLN